MTDSEDVRRFALSLPETEEKHAWGTPTFRVGGRMFALVAQDDTAVDVRCPVVDRTELIASEPEKFSLVPGQDFNNPWVRVRLAALDDTGELRDILVDSWQQTAPRRLSDAVGGSAAG